MASFNREAIVAAKSLLLALAALGLTAGTSLAAAPSAAQKAEFRAVCIKISGDETLCNCKADAAMTLIDGQMMTYVIAGMKGAGNAPTDVQREWNTYIARSNQICKPSY
jgi:hypothetical protein